MLITRATHFSGYVIFSLGLLFAGVQPGYATDTCHSNSDPKGLANGSNILFVDKHNCGCVDHVSRSPALNPNTPFCHYREAMGWAKPGDTIYVLNGRYGMKRANNPANTDGRADARLTLKGYPEQNPVITPYDLWVDPELWTQCQSISDCDGNPNWQNIFYVTLPKRDSCCAANPGSIISTSQDDILLALPTKADVNSSPSQITKPGMWAKDSDQRRVWIWARGGGNPGLYKTEIAYFRFGAADTFGLHNPVYFDKPPGPQPDYWTIENLTIEGGHNALAISANNIHIRNCTIRKSYGHAVKVFRMGEAIHRSHNGIIENNNIYMNGRSHIAMNAAMDWIIRNNKIHDSAGVAAWQEDNTLADVMTLKANSHRIIVEGNEIYNNKSRANPLINIGGIGGEGRAQEGVGIVFKNNIVYNSKSKWGTAFWSCHDCKIVNNLFYNNEFENLVLLERSNQKEVGEEYLNKNPIIKNNIFYKNKTNRILVRDNSTINLESDYNLFDVTPIFSGLDDKNLEKHSLIDVPSFLNESSYDFRLEQTSPGVDQGTDLRPIVDNDFNGIPRPKGQQFDIGPFEFYINSVSNPDHPKASGDQEQVQISPNPYHGNLESGPIHINNLENGTVVKILNPRGEEIKSIHSSGNSVEWDLKNQSGSKVVSGIYIYLIEHPDGQVTQKKSVFIR